MFERKIKTTPLFKPYNNDNKPTLKSNGKGIYYIFRNGRLHYIGKSSYDIKKTLYRHFQKWTDKRRDSARRWQIFERVTYYGLPVNEFKVKCLFIDNTDLIDTLEQALIKKHTPPDNSQKLAFYSAEQETAALDKIKLSNIETVKPDIGEDYF